MGEIYPGRLYTNPSVMVLAFDALLIMLGFGIIAPSMAFYLIALEGGLTQPPGPGYIVPDEIVASFAIILGVMMAAFMFSRTIFARYFGGLSDTRGRKPLLMTGLFGYFLLLILFGLARSWIDLLVIRFFQGVVSGMVWPVAEAALMDIVGFDRRGEGLGIYMFVSNIGFVTGPGLGGILYNFCRDFLLLPVPDVFRVPYFLGAVIVLPAVILTGGILKETSPMKIKEEHLDLGVENRKLESSHSPILEQPLTQSTRRMMKVLYIMALMNGIAMGLGQPLFQLFLMSKITTDIGLIGLIISGAGAIGMLFTVPAGRYADRHGRKGLAVWGAVGARATLAILPTTTSVIQTGAVWIAQSAAMSSSQPAMRAIQADIVPWSLRGKLFGTIQAFFNAGATVGPLVGGVMYAFFSLLTFNVGLIVIEGFMIPFWMAAGLGLIGALLVWKYIEETSPVQVFVEESNDIVDAT